jgi:valacyclovir hydrolase
MKMPWFEHGNSRIYYEDTGRGDPVLLLPGFSDHIGNHTDLRDALSGHYRVIAADLPGSGRSTPQPRTYHRGYYDEDAEAFTTLLHDLGIGPARLVGHSDGGEVALVMAVTSAQVVRSVLTWGSGGSVHDPDGKIAALFRNAMVDVIPAEPDYPVFPGYRDYLITNYGEDIARATTQSFANAIEEIVAAGGDILRGRADQITCPAMLLVGETDPFVSKPQIDDLAARMQRASAIEVEAAGHGIHEDRSEWFMKTVTDWLARH